MENGEKHGPALCIDRSDEGSHIELTFKNNKATGPAVEIRPDGTRVQFNYVWSSIYENTNRKGLAVETKPDGGTIRFEYADSALYHDKREGTVVENCHDDRYHYKREGTAVENCRDGRIIVFHYEDNKREGPAVEIRPDGSTLIFHYHKNKIKGLVVETASDGTVMQYNHTDITADEQVRSERLRKAKLKQERRKKLLEEEQERLEQEVQNLYNSNYITRNLSNGNRVQCTEINGTLEGPAVENRTDGSTLTFRYHNNNRQGFAVETAANNSNVAVCYYDNNTVQGPTMTKCDSGTVITAYFKDNKADGIAVENCPDGMVKHVNYKNSKRDGLLVSHTTDGMVKINEYKKGILEDFELSLRPSDGTMIKIDARRTEKPCSEIQSDGTEVTFSINRLGKRQGLAKEYYIDGRELKFSYNNDYREGLAKLTYPVVDPTKNLELKKPEEFQYEGHFYEERQGQIRQKIAERRLTAQLAAAKKSQQSYWRNNATSTSRGSRQRQ